MDYTSIHPSCTSLAHRIDLHLWCGAPKNLDAEHPVEILVNDGYVVGFCPTRLQPAWSAYRVAHADADVDYDRPLTYYDDMRLSPEHRIGPRTFGKLGGVQLNVGHMAPNEVINRQFGRLAQLETFMMSNMSPQYGSLNGGVWRKLESAIREIKDEKGRDHVWAIVGPVFGAEPASISRGHGKHLPVPDKYFCVTVDPHSYPYNTQSRAHIACFLIPQEAPRSSRPEDYPATLAEIEEATGLKFFEGWGREYAVGARLAYGDVAPSEHRLIAALRAARQEEAVEAPEVAADAEIDTITGLIETLEQEANQIKMLGRALTDDELTRLRMIQHTVSWLIRARAIAAGTPDEPEPEPKKPTLITYKIASDMDGKLKLGARTACNFWNRFVEPARAIVIRLGTFTENSYTIARAYKPWAKDDTRYGRVEFNTKYLAQFTSNEIAGTIVHEIGHTLGIGWDEWEALYSRDTGRFNPGAIEKLAALSNMEVELDYGPGTAYAHWDEEAFDRELMSGIQDSGEYVLPVTIDVMRLFGHEITERIADKTPLAELLEAAESVAFFKQVAVERLDLEHLEETEVFETIPHVPAES